MASNPFITSAAPLSSVPVTDIQAEAANLERQRRYAQMLMQQQPAQGQMVSGHYVAPSWTQNLQTLVNPLVGAYMEKQADTQALNLANQLRRQNMAEALDIVQTMRGTPARTVQEQATEQNLPQGQTMVDDQGVPTLVPVQKPAVAPNIELALAKAYGSQGTAGQGLAPVIVKQLTQEPEWATMTLVDNRTGNKMEYMWNKKSPDPISTLKPIGTSSEAIPRGQLLELIDKGVIVPAYSNPFSSQGGASGGVTSGAPAANGTAAPSGNEIGRAHV